LKVDTALRWWASLTLAISAAVLLICAVCFRLLTPEVKKYRALTIIVTSGWALVALGILQVFLGMFVIPVAKCGM